MGFVAILVVLALALRLANLTGQSLWADEGNSVRLTERTLSLVIAAARGDIHPPGYYVLLWGWARVFGQSEVAVRSFSVAIGVALVIVVYLMGKQWWNVRAGWLAGFCAAVSPFQVAYSQEVRMYILVALLGALTAYAFARWIEWGRVRHRVVWSAIYVLGAAGGLWTHYSSPVILVALNVAWLVWWLRMVRWRDLDRGLGQRSSREWQYAGIWWLALHLAVLILYLPWLATAWDKAWGYGPISSSHGVHFIVPKAFELLSVGETAPGGDLTRWLVLGVVGLAVFGAWAGLARYARSQKSTVLANTLALVLLILLPVVMLVALDLSGRPAYRPKFLLIASPAFCVLVGGGIASLEAAPAQRKTWASQLWLVAGMGLVGIAAVRSLGNYYSDSAYARADYRAIASLIAESERPGDVILLNAPNQWEVFTYYYRGVAPVYPVCRSRPCREDAARRELEQIAAEHERLYALYWATEESDPERVVEHWLEQHAFKASDVWFGDVRLATYGLPGSQDELALGAGEVGQPLADVLLGEDIALRGYTLASDQVRPGDVLRVTLYWESLQASAGRYKVFLHLLDAEGNLVSQVDSEPGDGMNLTSSWRPEHGVFQDRYGLAIPGSLPVGEYQVLLGMYDVSGAPRLPISIDGWQAGDALTLETVEVRQAEE